ncbi:ABC transporter permease [Actinopolyspora saharensis]|uniref:ABC transporter permease n=1 Tax=Actinopolyspora saharensis TaxID=995062 RepID=UPI003F670048
MSGTAGTGALVKLILRRDRIRIPAWIAGVAFFLLGSVASFPTAYGTAAERQARAALMNNPATVVLTGPGFGREDYTYGAMTANEMGGMTAVLIALMSILLVVRYSRHEEESGRTELLRSAVVGRHAPLAAALITVLGVNLVLGLVLGLGLPATLPELGLAGSLLFAAGLTSVGFVFTAVAAVTAQLMEHGRAASGLAGALLAACFALRGAGDLGDGTLSWLSPIGWAQRTRAYVDGTWWPLIPALLLTVLLVVLACTLRARRDEGAGLVRGGLGRTSASGSLSGPFALALRLQRGALTGWTVGFVLFGAFVGTIAEQAARFVASNETAQRFFEQRGQADSAETMIATYVSLMAMVAGGFALQSAGLSRAEESAGRLEPLLGGTPLSRARWAVANLAATITGSVLVLGGGGLGAGLVRAAAGGDGSDVLRVLAAALAHLPAVWVLAGIATLLFGLVPAASGLGWLVLAWAVFVGMFGPLLRLPDWLAEVSPFAHTPMLPTGDPEATPLIALTVTAVVLMAVGVTAFRRRDAA